MIQKDIKLYRKTENDIERQRMSVKDRGMESNTEKYRERKTEENKNTEKDREK